MQSVVNCGKPYYHKIIIKKNTRGMHVKMPLKSRGFFFRFHREWFN